MGRKYVDMSTIQRRMAGRDARVNRTFERQRAAGALPYLEEILPRVGRPRYRADLVDAYFAGTFRRPMLHAVLPRRSRVG